MATSRTGRTAGMAAGLVLALLALATGVRWWLILGPGAPTLATPMPALVQRAAAQFHFWHPLDRNTGPEVTVEERYASEFFKGFTCGPTCSTEGGDALSTQAYLSGVHAIASRPDEADAIMAGYGYRRVELRGDWIGSMERSEFMASVPDGPSGWVSPFGHPGKFFESVSNGSSPVRLVAYVSPKSRYGHLGRFDHLLLVISGQHL